MFLVSLSVAKTAANVSTQARLAQSVEHETLNLRVVGSSPTLGANFYAQPKGKFSLGQFIPPCVSPRRRGLVG